MRVITSPNTPHSPHSSLHPQQPQTTASWHTTGVSLDGLVNVLGKHLYSTPEVAVRELVQNAHDSIIRRRIENPEFTAIGAVRVEANAAQGILTIRDNGSGLTESEIHNYLATVGVGYTRRLRESNDEAGQAMIGLFGLGFLSAFVIAEKVIVDTVSYQTPEETWRYSSENGQRYTLIRLPRLAGEDSTAGDMPAIDSLVGTTITLHLQPDFHYLAAPGVLQRVLGHYCVLLREQVWFDDVCINKEPPPWRGNGNNGVVEHPAVLQKKRLVFAMQFEQHFEPICTFPVISDKGFDLQGLLWVQDGATYGTSDNRNLRVFVRGMLLDDDAKELLPYWAGFIGGVIECSELTPTASREDLQRDEVYYRVQRLLAQALIQGLCDLPKQQRPAWNRMLRRHNESLLGAALCDDNLFAVLSPSLTLPSSQGDLSVTALRHEGSYHVSLGQNEFEDMLFRALQIPVARGERYAVLGFLRHYVSHYGGKLVEIGTERGNMQLFQHETLPHASHTWLESQLCDQEKLVPARFAPAALPLVVVPDRDAEMKQRLESDEADARMSAAALALVRQHTKKIDGSAKARLFLNLDNPAIQDILRRYANGETTTPVSPVALNLLRAFKNMAFAQHVEKSETLLQGFNDFATALQTLLGIEPC